MVMRMENQAEWLTAYVEKCMREVCGEESVDDAFNGVVAFRSGTADCQVRVEAVEPVMVRVMARAVIGVHPTAKLLREINAVNACSRVANCWWCDGDVVVECSLFAEAVNPTSLAAACWHVSEVANDIGVGFAAMYDGSTPYPPFASDAEDAA